MVVRTRLDSDVYIPMFFYYHKCGTAWFLTNSTLPRFVSESIYLPSRAKSFLQILFNRIDICATRIHPKRTAVSSHELAKSSDFMALKDVFFLMNFRGAF